MISTTYINPRPWLWVAACVLAGSAACDSAEPDQPLPKTAGSDRIQTTIDSKGAELVLGDDLRVRVPEGALREPVEVTIERAEPSELVAREPNERRSSDAIRMEPHGLEFEEPVEIEVRVNEFEGEEVPDERLRMMRLEDEEDETWEDVGKVRVLRAENASELEDLPADERSLRGSRRVQATSRRFSIYTVVALGTGDESAPVEGGGTDMGGIFDEDGGTTTVRDDPDAGTARSDGGGGLPDAPACEQGFELCEPQFDESYCADTLNDPRNCGGCAPDQASRLAPACELGVDCITGCSTVEECNAMNECEMQPFGGQGTQACLTGSNSIDCTSLNSRMYCGSCDNACAAEEECQEGSCVPRTCPEGQRPCGFFCRDVNVSCGVDCDVNESCTEGLCVSAG